MVWQGILGIFAFIGIAWLSSENRGAVRRRVVIGGILMQALLAALLIGLPPVQAALMKINGAVQALQEATRTGTSFVFGYIGGGPLPFTESYPGAAFTLAFQALPLILVVSALAALLFHWRILPAVVRGFSLLLERSLGIGGAVGVGVAANIFIGMVEAPLLIRPYLERLDRGELFCVMTAGMATIAGTVMVLYASILGTVMPDAVGHILTASILSAPAAVMIAEIMVPSNARTSGGIELPSDGGALAAITRGTMDGVQLLINVIAMLIVAVALVALANAMLGLLPEIGGQPLALERILGWLMAPVAFLMGIPWADAVTAGGLLGIKIVLNEFLAYLQLAEMPAGMIGERSRAIMIYGLCGFANFGSLGIMIGGIATMAPGQRQHVISLGGKSIVAGTLATCMTGAIAGLFL